MKEIQVFEIYKYIKIKIKININRQKSNDTSSSFLDISNRNHTHLPEDIVSLIERGGKRGEGRRDYHLMVHTV